MVLANVKYNSIYKPPVSLLNLLV